MKKAKYNTKLEIVTQLNKKSNNLIVALNQKN